MFFINVEPPLGWSIKGETDSNTERTRQQAVQRKWKQIGNRRDKVSEQNVGKRHEAKRQETENLNSKRG